MYRKSVRLGQEGQALLEYIMLLSIATIIIGAFVYQFNDSFRRFSIAYFVGPDSYLYCLISEGLLPGQESDNCTLPRFDKKSGRLRDVAAGASEGSGAGGVAGESRGAGKKKSAEEGTKVATRRADETGGSRGGGSAYIKGFDSTKKYPGAA